MPHLREELAHFIDSHPVINTHCHHLDAAEFKGFDLDKVLERSYVSWAGVPIGETDGERNEYLNKVRFKSYFVWLQKSLAELYGLEGPISAERWSGISAKIADAHRDPEHHLRLLRETCRYEKVILDAYWNPGSDHGVPELFRPTYRINMFLYGYDDSACDHNGNNPRKVYSKRFEDIDEYVAFLREMVRKKKSSGCVAIKSALAYDRGLDFEDVPKRKANEVFRKRKDPSGKEIKHFQDYVFHRICEIADETGLPFQCHTGLGELVKTEAIRLRDIIAGYPNARFVLFHGGYPWPGDVLGLLHRFPNVYADICWLPILSYTAAERTLHELIEVGTSEKVTWGCDTWSSEESYGALMAFRQVLADVLASKVSKGYFSPGDAKEVAGRIMRENAANLYGL